MKKYIIFQLMMTAFAAFHASCMEVALPCYLATLPVEILNYIEHFLTCDDETDEEFIARTLAAKQEKEKEQAGKRYGNEGGSRLFEEAYNVYKTKKIRLTRLDIYEYNDDQCSAWLIDCDANKWYGYKEKLEDDLEDTCCHGLALSSSGRMFAFVHSKKFHGEKRSSIVVEIIKMDIKEKKEDEEDGVLILQERRALSCDKFRFNIAFNKQGNKLIAYEFYSPFDYKVFPLKIVDPTAPQITDDTNKLQSYLRDKGVFKNKCIEGKK